MTKVEKVRSWNIEDMVGPEFEYRLNRMTKAELLKLFKKTHNKYIISQVALDILINGHRKIRKNVKDILKEFEEEFKIKDNIDIQTK